MARSQAMQVARAVGGAATRTALVVLRDVGDGMLQVGRNAFALLGLVLASVILFGAGRADIRHEAEAKALGWLQARQVARVDPVVVPPALTVASASDVSMPSASNVSFLTPVALPTVVSPTVASPALAEPNAPAEPRAIARATASDLKELSRPQAAVAIWLSRRYRVAPEPVGALVKEAWQIGNKAGLDPTLILAIMAVESSFNPFAQSAVGAQGLMQVMTKVHNAKYEAFGGNHAAFDPVSNLRVGVQVLKECIAHAGSLEAGLRFYVGSGNQAEDGGYAGKVLSEQNSLKLVVGGKAPPPRAPIVTTVVTTGTAPAHGSEAPAAASVEPKAEASSPVARPEEIALLHDSSVH